MSKIATFMIVSVMTAFSASAAEIGYSTETASKTNTFIMESSVAMQGQAIRLSKAKLQILKGKTIDFVEFAVGSKNTKSGNIHVFITTSLNGKSIAEDDIKVTKPFARNKWTLDEPYYITGDEDELFIGYTAEIDKNYKMLLADGNYDIKGCNYALKNGEWVDTYGMGCGSAFISMNVEDAPDYADVIIGKSDLRGYHKIDDGKKITVNFINAGTAPINSFDATTCVNGVETTQHFAGVNIAPHEGYCFESQGVDNGMEGQKDFTVSITNVNGSIGDADASDNTVCSSVYLYPKNMERGILVEEFTGQNCSGCPNGHRKIEQAIALAEQNIDAQIVEVSHHSGYYNDIFTMKEDDEYRFFYADPIHTLAPAVMANRIAEDMATSPLIAAIDMGSIAKLIENAFSEEPYASLNFETSWSKDTRNLDVRLQVMPHANLPKSAVFNIFLVQDGIEAYQNNGGDNYRHAKVFRGTLTNQPLGLPLGDVKPGETMTWEQSFNIPETIHSSFYTDDMLQEVEDENGNKSLMYVFETPLSNVVAIDAEQTNIKVVDGDITLVAYVAEYDADSNLHNRILNCCEVKLGESHKQGAFDDTNSISVAEKCNETGICISNGKIRVNGEYDKMYVYDMYGRQINADNIIAKGTYVVRITYGNNVKTKKILVR